LPQTCGVWIEKRGEMHGFATNDGAATICRSMGVIRTVRLVRKPPKGGAQEAANGAMPKPVQDNDSGG